MCSSSFVKCILLYPFVTGLPVQYIINHHAEECLYEKVKKGESFTISAIILGGSRLEAHVTVDGPVAPPETDSSLRVMEAAARYGKGESYGDSIKFSFQTDFENLNILDDEIFDDEDDDSALGEEPRDGESPQETRARRAKECRKVLEKRYNEERMRRNQKRKIRDEGKPLQKTFTSKTDGWFRLCVEAPGSEIAVELDFRTESDYGGMGSHGHVLTMEEKAMKEEEEEMRKATASEEGIKDEDFQSTREKLNTLRRLLADIQSKQTQERHRLMVHSATNEHSHSRMVLSSLLETVLFMLITGFQVFTIRRWFTGSPSLGR